MLLEPVLLLWRILFRMGWMQRLQSHHVRRLHYRNNGLHAMHADNGNGHGYLLAYILFLLAGLHCRMFAVCRSR
jgi:hypothetical protein